MPSTGSKDTDCSRTICSLIWSRAMVERPKTFPKGLAKADQPTSLINYRDVSEHAYFSLNESIRPTSGSCFTGFSTTHICTPDLKSSQFDSNKRHPSYYFTRKRWTCSTRGSTRRRFNLVNYSAYQNLWPTPGTANFGKILY